MKGIGLTLAGLLACVAVGAVVWLGPYYREAWVLDGVVRAVLLDWRDFGREQAIERLQYELDARGIGPHLQDDDCRFIEDQAVRTVACEWTVEVAVPFTDHRLPLAFSVDAHLSPEGSLH